MAGEGWTEGALREVIADIAASTPAPGGGSTAALACALAAALTEMVAAFREAPASGRAAEMRERALALAERDLDSYPPVMDAVRLPVDDERRPDAIARALSDASAVPLEVAQIGAELAELAARLTEDANLHTAGDGAVAAVLAEGVCQASATLVALNLKGTADVRQEQAAQLVVDASAARRRALRAAHGAH